MEEFSDQWFRDPQILGLAHKVNYKLDPSIDYPRHFSGHVMIKLRGNRVVEENQPHPRGGFELPLPPDELEAKFRSNAGMALAEKNVEEIIAQVKNLEALPSAGSLTGLLAPD